jgi:hypothetical protein
MNSCDAAHVCALTHRCDHAIDHAPEICEDIDTPKECPYPDVKCEDFDK